MAQHAGVWLVVLLLALTSGQACGAGHAARAFARMHATAAKPCQPWTVPAPDRCAYVRDHADVCYPNGGFQQYLVVHYCTFGPSLQWLSLLVLLGVALLAFAVLMTVSERFFCPALELISDYLQLPPVVAGATLLSFGNGAPDTFTQVAAVTQEGAAVGMALAEPLGGGLFASNMVLGLVVLMASKQQVYIQRRPFLKDAGFYLLALLVITVLIADGKVTIYEACIMFGVYVAYVCVTFYASRQDEPLHADVALHEVPPTDGGVDAHDSGSEDLADSCCGPEYADATTSITGYDLEAPHASDADSDESEEPRTAVAAAAAGVKRGARGGAHGRSLAAQLVDKMQRGGGAGGGSGSLREPLLVRIEEVPGHSPTTSSCSALAPGSAEWEADSSGDTVVGGLPPASSTGRHSVAVGTDAPAEAPTTAGEGAAGAAGETAAAAAAAAAAATPGSRRRERALRKCSSDAGGARNNTGRHGQLPSPLFAHGSQGFASPASLAAPASPRQQQQQPLSAQQPLGGSSSRRASFTEGARLLLRAHTEGGGVSDAPGGPTSPHALLWASPRAASDSGLASARSAFANGAHKPLLALPMPGSPLTHRHSAGSDHSTSDVLSPHWQQLQQQHQAEQAELLEQQAAEQVALLVAHEEGALKALGGRGGLKQRLQHPLVQLLSCTMPRVGTGSGHHYARWRACLLPLTVPLVWLCTDVSMFGQVGWRGLLVAAAGGAVGSSIIWATYPASHVPRKALKGVFALLAFLQAVVWLDISASGLVQVVVVVGVIFGLPPALLGATVLAYSNSVPDLINNVAMARDGFPSMAVAACFASPLFTLLVGMGGALAYGAVLHGGALLIPVDGPLCVMAAFAMLNMVQHLTLIPWVHRYRMQPSMAVAMFLFYVTFNVTYCLASVGVIKVQGLWPQQP